MAWGSFFVLFGLLALLVLIEQRADPTARKAVRYFTYFGLFLILVFVWWYSLWSEAIAALVASAVFASLFWLLIGRYNPASSSDDIHVLGMDD